MNAQQNISTTISPDQPKHRKRLVLLITIACILGVFALAWQRILGWQSQRKLISQLTAQLSKIEKLSATSLNSTKRGNFQGVTVMGTRFTQVTEEVPGWYKVTQHRLQLDTEIAFLRERVDALQKIHSIAYSLPDEKSEPLMEAFRRCQEKWLSVVPSEIKDDENCNWDKLATEFNSVLATFAKEVRELPYVKQ